MYRRPKFLEVLDEVRQEMSHEADYDVELFADIVRNSEESLVKDKNLNADIVGELYLEEAPKNQN